MNGDYQSTNFKTKEYTFMLILPDSIIQDKINFVKSDVSNYIIRIFIIPFVIFSVFMMVATSYFLNRIST